MGLLCTKNVKRYTPDEFERSDSVVSRNDIVLTTVKNNGRSTMRLERMFTRNIDSSNVDHTAGGPYRGIRINKARQDFDDVEPAEGRVEFLAYLVNEMKNGNAVQDHWTLKFWFRGKTEGVEKKKIFTNYFQELTGPTNFPKNYIGFIKKALILLKGYPVIKRVELDVRHTGEEEEEEEEITTYTSVFTPQNCTYMCLPEVPVKGKHFLTFMVQSSGDAHLALSAVYGDATRKTYEIIIGGHNNTKSLILDGANGPVQMEAVTLNVLDENEFRYFWINWLDHHVEVGQGPQYGYGRFLHWHVPPHKQFRINCLQIRSGKAGDGQWEFAEIIENDKEQSMNAKRNRIKMSFLWLARKQKFLQYLEDIYPNAASSAQLFKHCRIKSSDMMTAVVMLDGLHKRGLIKEIEKGHWMRVQTSGQNVSSEEFHVVKAVPRLTTQEQPTIAIITSRYCEKLAVDAVIDDKKTYVKCKTEGESQLYTTGIIGRHRVVSTKLSCEPGAAQSSKISAGNTVTRLLGTFSKVEHVFLVGVASAVPHYSDQSKHVRLGDVVVSMPMEGSEDMYIRCTQVSEGSQKFDFKTKSWKRRDTTLTAIVENLRRNSENGNDFVWDKYALEAGIELNADETMFHKPAIETDRLFITKPNGSVVQVKHPLRENDEKNQITVKYSPIGFLENTKSTVRDAFASRFRIKAFDNDFEAVLESLEGNRNESFLIIRGMATYMNVNRHEWQPYASLVAAAYMKAVIMAL